jgi:hypothetical protein
MSHLLSRWLLPAGLIAVASSIGAAERNAKPDPLDPAASAPAAVHRSAFASYQRMRDDKLLPWKQANDEVTRIGGWRSYAREAAQPTDTKPAAPAASAAAPAPASAPGGHGRH